jgi:hypothetical protein
VRELIREFLSGGVVVVDRLPGSEEIGFRTLVQPDGDVCLSINRLAFALAPEEFHAQLADHQRHVTAVLTGLRARLRRLMSGFGVGFGIVGGASGMGMSVQLDLASLAQITPEVMVGATGLVGAVLFAAMRAWVLRWALRRWCVTWANAPTGSADYRPSP